MQRKTIANSERIKDSQPPAGDDLIFSKLRSQIQNRDVKGTEFLPMPYVNYKPAEIRNSGSKMFIQFSFRDPRTSKWVRFKKYGAGSNMGLNRIKDLDERTKLARRICKAYNQLFEEGYVPPELKLGKDPEQKKNWTLFQALNLWKLNTENKIDRKSTISTYGSMINHFLKKFKGLHEPIALITRQDVESFLVQLKKTESLSNTTFNNYLRLTKIFFNYCIGAGLLEKNPAQQVKKVKAVVSKHKYFTDEEFSKIKKHAPERLLRFLEFLYETGVRPNEARQVQYKHVHGDKLFVPGKISKNKKDEYVPLSVDYAKKLVGEPDHYIFGGNKMVGINHYGNLFADLKDLLQLDKNHTLYGCKHLRAVHLIRDKIDPYSIMRLFRHSSLEITMRYIRDLGMEINREAVEKGRSF